LEEAADAIGVKLRSFLHLVRDLIEVLPSTTEADWEDVDQLSYERPTVVLVSGFAATRRSLSVMRKRLRKDGFNVLILCLDWTNLSDGVRGLYRMAEKLSTIVTQLRKQRGMQRNQIHLVAHSAGGLVARYYIQMLGGWHYCDSLVTLATPHQGTWLAALGLFTHLLLKFRCLFQLLPISPFIKHLNAAPLPEDFRLVSIFSKGDLMCPARATQLPPVLRSRVPSIELEELGHSDFLWSKESYEVLRGYLGVPAVSPTARQEISENVD